jgi:hypothetical protein
MSLSGCGRSGMIMHAACNLPATTPATFLLLIVNRRLSQLHAALACDAAHTPSGVGCAGAQSLTARVMPEAVCCGKQDNLATR